MGLLDFLGKALMATEKAAKEASEYLALEKEVMLANRDLELNVHAERYAIDAVISLSETQLESEKYMEQSAWHRESYLESLSRLEKALETSRGATGAGGKKEKARITIPPVPPREPHPDGEVEKEILSRRANIIRDRDKHYGEIRQRLRADPRLGELVRKNLQEMGCGDCWSRIS